MKFPASLFTLLSLCTAVFSAEKYTIAMIPKGTTHEFWKSVHAGGLRAVEELKAEGITVELIWKGPLKEDDRDQQIALVENFTARKVSGICLAPLDSQALVRPVNSAAKAKVPVVVFDSGVKTGEIVSYVATDNFKGGQLGGEALVAHLQGKPVEKRIDTGVVVVTKENMADPANAELLRPPLEKYLK